MSQKAGESAQSVMAALSRVSDDASKAGSAEISVTVTSPDTGGKPVQMKGFYTWGDGVAMETEMAAKEIGMEPLVADGTVTARLVDGTYYYGVDPVASGPFEGKTWLKVEASAVLGEKGAAGMNSVNGDPTAGLKTLKYAKDVTTVATESVNGKNAVHYRATVPAGQVASDAADMQKNLGLQGEIVTDIWIDDNGAPARLDQSGGNVSMSMEFLSFGANRTVEAPPAADTADMTEFIKKQKQGGTA
ncbi:hypothetical protein ABZZ17_35850 [Streptomyces sp. NPDC006512]|uniref:hypothetical protein n=1 Tax=Streptomyces sp. NPDC006512 TaxID=3154307 RepID=UPI0033A5065A